jgi:hypothetical protein
MSALRAAALVLADELAGKAPVQQKVDVLILTMPDGTKDKYHSAFKTFAGYHYAGRNPVVEAIDKPEKLVAVLKGYSEVNELVLAFHSSPSGTLQIGNEIFYLRSDALAKLLSEVSTVVKSIELSACNVGQDPHAMLALAKLLEAQKIVGWTQYFILDPFQLEVSDEAPIDAFMEIVERYRDYLPRGFPDAAALKTELRAARRKPLVKPAVWQFFSFDPDTAVKNRFPVIVPPLTEALHNALVRATDHKTPQSRAHTKAFLEANVTKDKIAEEPLARVEVTLKPAP